jgi:hypothetical protein
MKGVLGGSGGRRRLNETERMMMIEENPLDIMSPEERAAMRRDSYTDKYIDSILTEDEREDERRLRGLQAPEKFQVNFVDCLFDVSVQ